MGRHGVVEYGGSVVPLQQQRIGQFDGRDRSNAIASMVISTCAA
jgi:hypothetical protein